MIANRIIPEWVSDPYFSPWKESQIQYRQEIQASFQPLPIKEVPLFGEELCGLAALEQLKETLYEYEDPTQVYYQETTLRVLQQQGYYTLSLYLPGVSKDKIQLHKSGDELNIRIGNHHRNLILPQALAAHQPVSANMNEDYLNIQFDADVTVEAAA